MARHLTWRDNLWIMSATISHLGINFFLPPSSRMNRLDRLVEVKEDTLRPSVTVCHGKELPFSTSLLKWQSGTHSRVKSPRRPHLPLPHPLRYPQTLAQTQHQPHHHHLHTPRRPPSIHPPSKVSHPSSEPHRYQMHHNSIHSPA